MGGSSTSIDWARLEPRARSVLRRFRSEESCGDAAAADIQFAKLWDIACEAKLPQLSIGKYFGLDRYERDSICMNALLKAARGFDFNRSNSSFIGYAYIKMKFDIKKARASSLNSRSLVYINRSRCERFNSILGKILKYAEEHGGDMPMTYEEAGISEDEWFEYNDIARFTGAPNSDPDFTGDEPDIYGWDADVSDMLLDEGYSYNDFYDMGDE